MLEIKLKNHIKSRFENLDGSHDWFHILRVHQTSLKLADSEPTADKSVVSILALLHDISDHKLNGGLFNQGSSAAQMVLTELEADAYLIEKVCPLVDEISFKGAGVEDAPSCIESKIVQDADRLDAIGAIGIARAFSFGGSKNRPLFVPTMAPEFHDDFQTYASSKSHTINHFYEKLLLLKDRMHTQEAKRLAEERHAFMLAFLKQFENEWGKEV
jgi:uncharacterized protein